MFKANGNHVQPPLFSPSNVLPEVSRKRLDRDWSTAFYWKAGRLLGEQGEVQGGRVKPRSPDRISSGSMQNPWDPDATFRRKRDEEHRGCSTHAAETCDPENELQIITHIEAVRNNMDDADVPAKELLQLNEGTGLEAMIVDGGFLSSGVREVCDALHVELVASAIRGPASPNGRRILPAADGTQTAGRESSREAEAEASVGRRQFRRLITVRSRMILKGMTVNFGRHYRLLLLSFPRLLGDFACPENLRLLGPENA